MYRRQTRKKETPVLRSVEDFPGTPAEDVAPADNTSTHRGEVRKQDAAVQRAR